MKRKYWKKKTYQKPDILTIVCLEEGLMQQLSGWESDKPNNPGGGGVVPDPDDGDDDDNWGGK